MIIGMRLCGFITELNVGIVVYIPEYTASIDMGRDTRNEFVQQIMRLFLSSSRLHPHVNCHIKKLKCKPLKESKYLNKIS